MRTIIKGQALLILSAFLFFAAESARPASSPPVIVQQPQSQSAPSGADVTFTVGVTGGSPLRYQWYFNGFNVPGGTNATLLLPSITFTQSGVYAVSIGNSSGSAFSDGALLQVDPQLTFRITNLRTNGVIVVDHSTLTGTDRPGMAVSANGVFVNGSSATARYNSEFLTGGQSVGQRYQAIVSDLRTEKAYALAFGTNLLTSTGGTLDSLIEIDGATGALTTRVVLLSTNIPISSSSDIGFFSGYGRIVIHIGGDRAYNIMMPSGEVTDLGYSSYLNHNYSSLWGYWGVAEYLGGQIYLLYAQYGSPDVQFIARTRLPGYNPSTTAATFGDLNDMASFTFSPSLSRWFFHYEGASSQLGGFSQTLGSAKALYTTSPEFPVIYSDPSYTTTYPGSNAAFSVQVASGLPLSYQWRFNGADIPGGTNAILLLTNVAPDEQGGYSVAVSNRVGVAVSAEGSLQVITVPVIYSSPGNRSVYAGGSTVFSGAADGAPPYFFQWYYKGQEISDATNTTLVLTNIQSLQQGSYSFSVSNKYGVVNSDSAFLTVIAEPIILSPPVARAVNLGTNASFGVTADGAPPLRYQWQFNGTNIASATNRTLNLTNVQPAMEGSYTIVISNRFGVASASAALTVVTIPSILANPLGKPGVQGETMTLTVKAQGPGTLYYQWRFNGVNIPGETNRVFSIPNFQAANAGTYAVVVYNTYGSILSDPAVVTFFPIQPEGASFRISTLTANGAKVVDHDFLTSDDRGGIAVSLDSVFITGDSSTAKFDLALTNGIALNKIYDGLASNLRNGRVYLLASNDVPVSEEFSGTLINRLLELDGNTGELTGNQIPLSQSIPVYTSGSQNGIFSGYDRIVLHNGTNVFLISLPSGVVSNLGPTTISSHSFSESWAYWGVAENFGGSISLVYVRNSTTISRTRVPDGTTTTLASFSRLSDMASFTVALYTNRWYFHHEGSSQFGGSSETLGYATATFDINPVAYFEWGMLDSAQIVGAPFTVTITARTAQNNIANTFNGPVNLIGTNVGGGLVSISPTASANFTNGVWSGQIRVLQASPGMSLLATNSFGSTGSSAVFRVLPTDDVSVSVVDSPRPVPVTTTLTYRIEVTNTGPSQASGVLLTNILSTNALFQTVTSSQGSCANDAGVVHCDLGGLPGKAAATIVIEVVPLVSTSMTNRVSIFRAEADATSTNNTVLTVTSVTLPQVSISDATLVEGNSGTNNMVFNLTLYPPSTNTARVNYNSSSSNALSGSDFVFKSGTVTFAPGETNQTISIGIIGDTIYELDETFSVNLSIPANCFIVRSSARGTIINDDPIPTLTVTDASLVEGNSGTNNMAFSVRLSGRSGLPVTLNYSTSDGSARAGSDYLARSGTVLFNANTTVLTQSIAIPVIGETLPEPNETFFLNLLTVSNAVATQTRAIGTILGDDGMGMLDHFTVSVSGTQQTVNVAVPVTVVAKDLFENTVTNFTGPVRLQAGTGTDPDEKHMLEDIGYSQTFQGDFTLCYGFTPSVDMVVTGVRHYVGTKVSIWTAAGQLVTSVPVVSTFGTWLETALPDPVVLNGGVDYIVGYYSGGSAGINAFGTNIPTSFADGTITNVFYSSGDAFPINSINGSYYYADLVYYTGQAFEPIASTPTNSGVFADGTWTGNITILDTADAVRLLASDGARHAGQSTPFDVVGIPNANVGIFLTAEKNPSSVGSNLVLNLTITNRGPAHASGLTVSNILPAGFQLVSASLSQGAWSNGAGVVWLNLDTLPNNGAATASLTVLPSQVGVFTNRAGVALSQNDPAPWNNAAVLALTIYRDSDGDGMWDDWELSVGLNPFDPSDAVLDPDGDGFTNLQEFLAGTDPHQANSVLRIAQIQFVAGDVHIRFQGVAGKKYRLEKINGLGLEDWTSVLEFKVGASRDVDLVDPFVPSGRFYRIRLLE